MSISCYKGQPISGLKGQGFTALRVELSFPPFSNITMVSAFALFSNFLLVSVALAAPNSKSRLEARLERRRAGRQSQPVKIIKPSGPIPLSSNSSHDEISSNWAGAVWDSYPSVCQYFSEIVAYT